MSKFKRTFIAINLPQSIKQKLATVQNKWPDLPCRWIPERNLHLTLAFLGNTGEKDIESINEVLGKIASLHSVFSIKLESIKYGPPGKMPPSLIWIEGKPTKQLIRVKNDMEKGLAETIGYKPEKREFKPHITLGRINKTKWRRMEPEKRTKIKSVLKVKLDVNSIDFMESQLKRSGAEYKLISSHKLTQSL